MKDKLLKFNPLWTYITIAILLSISSLHAQVLETVGWKAEISSQKWKVGDTLIITMKGKIDKDWYVYASDFDEECGPVVASIEKVPENNAPYQFEGKLLSIDTKQKYDDIFECNVNILEKIATFKQSIIIKELTKTVTMRLSYQSCSSIDGKCILYDKDFTFDNKSSKVEEKTGLNNPKATKNGNSQYPIKKMEPFYSFANTSESVGLWQFLILAFLSGLVSLLTPCVFPMIPMTVTFFTSKKSITSAIFYGVFIIVIYTAIGALLAPLMGADSFNHWATEWLPNVIFFCIFIIFALSFLGMFEIVLPSGIVNFADKNSEKGGLIGVFFMALTLVLVSFSCTGPIVGTLLVESVGGGTLKPILGMFVFGLSFALPFTLFAMFPNLLNKLPKSGGWLNSVKVVLGFLELALAFKFISIADQAFHWGIFDRELYLAIWIAIFTLLGFYLLGKIKLPHDSEMKKIGVPRLILAVSVFTFVTYMIPGMWGHPLKAMSGYLPPLSTHDFDLLSKINSNDNDASNLNVNKGCAPPSHSDILHYPHGLQGYFDLDEALKCAKAINKPIFVDFTGHGCVNCREMEAVVWSEKPVLRLLNNDYVMVALYVDDKTELEESKWYISAVDNKVKKHIGRQNADLQIQRANNNAQPNYVLLDHNLKALLPPRGYDLDPVGFQKYLKEGLKEFSNKNK